MKKAGIILFIALIGFVGSSFVNTTTTVQDNEEALTWHTDLGKVHDISQKQENQYSVFLLEATGVDGVTNYKERFLLNQHL